MDRVPTRRLVPYLLGALVVLVGGAWVLAFGERSPAGGDAGAAVILAGAGTASAPASGSTTDSLGVSGAGGDSSPVSAPAPTATTSTAPLFVQVAGEVRRPGVYQVPAGSRVFEVLRRAGGPTENGDEQALPLAAVVSDGCRIVVPRRGHASGEDGGVTAPGTVSPVGPTPGVGAAGQASPKVSLNSATAEQLEELPGVGPKTAAAIVAYREEHGPFAAVDDLQAVSGIGPVTVEKLRALVTP